MKQYIYVGIGGFLVPSLGILFPLQNGLAMVVAFLSIRFSSMFLVAFSLRWFLPFQ